MKPTPRASAKAGDKSGTQKGGKNPEKESKAKEGDDGKPSKEKSDLDKLLATAKTLKAKFQQVAHFLHVAL